jgi:hypothetical protein
MFLGISDPVSEIPHRGRVSHPKTQDVQNWEALVDPKVDLPPWNRQWLGKIDEKPWDVVFSRSQANSSFLWFSCGWFQMVSGQMCGVFRRKRHLIWKIESQFGFSNCLFQGRNTYEHRQPGIPFLRLWVWHGMGHFTLLSALSSASGYSRRIWKNPAIARCRRCSGPESLVCILQNSIRSL